MQVKTKIRGLKEVQEYIKSVPRGSVKVAIAALKDWFIGKDGRGLRRYEPYKHVSPFRSYSDNPEKAARQRRWIFAHLDQIGKNNRTGATANAWRFNETNNGYGGTFQNDSPGAKWLWSDANQTRQNAAVGHRTVSSKIASNMAGALRHARAAINKWLKSK